MNFALRDPDEIAKAEREDALREAAHKRKLADRAAEREAIKAARARYEEAVAEDDYIRPKIAGIPGVRMEPRR